MHLLLNNSLLDIIREMLNSFLGTKWYPLLDRQDVLLGGRGVDMRLDGVLAVRESRGAVLAGSELVRAVRAVVRHGGFLGCAEERAQEGDGGSDHHESVLDDHPTEEEDGVVCRNVSIC